MSSKNLQINVEPEILTTLKKNNYVLCIAKMVNDDYTVIWQGLKTILGINNFSWEPKYEMFGTRTFSSGFQVSASTGSEPIEGGQTCTLSSSGNLSSASGAIDASSPFFMKNQYGPINPGVNLVMPDGSTLPIYVDQFQAIIGTVQLLPKEKVQVWFQRSAETSTMISKVTGTSIELDFTGVSSHTVTYSDQQKWIPLSLNANHMFVLPNGNPREAVSASGFLNFLVRFQPTIQMAICASFRAYMIRRLTRDGYRPQRVEFREDGNLEISFPQTDAMEYICVGVVPDYETEICEALEGAADLPNDETWNIEPEQTVKGESHRKALLKEAHGVAPRMNLLKLTGHANTKYCE